MLVKGNVMSTTIALHSLVAVPATSRFLGLAPNAWCLFLMTLTAEVTCHTLMGVRDTGVYGSWQPSFRVLGPSYMQCIYSCS